MIILMKCLDEEYSVKRCIEDFHAYSFIERVIVVDGGSTDMTVFELKQFEKVEVYIHPWLDWYHDMEVSQSNIALSYVPNGSLCMIMDFDERMSDDLVSFLHKTNMENNLPHGHIVNISRKTYEVVRSEDAPYCAVIDYANGWPTMQHQIGQYPDYQTRLFRKTPYLKWINSPHHVMAGHTGETNVIADIIHYEKDDPRARRRLEIKWARAQARRKELGLTADVFECDLKQEFKPFGEPGTWGSIK